MILDSRGHAFDWYCCESDEDFPIAKCGRIDLGEGFEGNRSRASCSNWGEMVLGISISL